MNKSGLQIAGWIAVVNAALTVPLLALQAITARAGPTPQSTAIQMLNVLLFLYVLSRLRALLAQKQFARANACIAAIIGITPCVQFMALFVIGLPVLMAPLLAGLVALGILYIVTGTRLFKFSAALPGLKLFSYAAIVAGVCSVSIVLALIVLPMSVIMDIALAIVFFREAGNSTVATARVPVDHQPD